MIQRLYVYIERSKHSAVEGMRMTGYKRLSPSRPSPRISLNGLRVTRPRPLMQETRAMNTGPLMPISLGIQSDFLPLRIVHIGSTAAIRSSTSRSSGCAVCVHCSPHSRRDVLSGMAWVAASVTRHTPLVPSASSSRTPRLSFARYSLPYT